MIKRDVMTGTQGSMQAIKNFVKRAAEQGQELVIMQRKPVLEVASNAKSDGDTIAIIGQVLGRMAISIGNAKGFTPMQSLEALMVNLNGNAQKIVEEYLNAKSQKSSEKGQKSTERTVTASDESELEPAPKTSGQA